jgi:ectoine hydroxylase-related dioxygenase (phytanoyl-CoA dioxygenase family)
MHKGSVLLMHKHTPHSSGRNTTDGVRWSMDLRYQATGTPTGRPFHPAFVVRSQRDPNSVLTDYDVWCRRWVEALAKSKEKRVHRWSE